MNHIELLYGQTWRERLIILGITSEILRLEITWAPVGGSRLKKWTLTGGIEVLGAYEFAYYLTNLETVRSGSGTWQIEVVCQEFGVEKSFRGTYEILRSANITANPNAIIPVDFDSERTLNFAEVLPTETTHNYSYFNTESLLRKTVPVAGLVRGDVVMHNMGGIVAARFVGTDLNENRGVYFEYEDQNSVKIYPPSLGLFSDTATGFVQFTLLVAGLKQRVIELADAINGQVITHPFAGAPVVGRFVGEDNNQTDAPYLRYYSASQVTIQVPEQEGVGVATFTGKLLLEAL